MFRAAGRRFWFAVFLGAVFFHGAVHAAPISEATVKQWCEAARGFVRKHTKCLATRDDVAQETVRKVLRNGDKVQLMSEAGQRAYIEKTAERTFIDWGRSNERQRKLTEEAGRRATPASELSIPDQLIAKENLERFNQWLGKQDPLDQRIWRLRAEDLTFEQVAVEVGRRTSTVKRRFYDLQNRAVQEFTECSTEARRPTTLGRKTTVTSEINALCVVPDVAFLRPSSQILLGVDNSVCFRGDPAVRLVGPRTTFITEWRAWPVAPKSSALAGPLAPRSASALLGPSSLGTHASGGRGALGAAEMSTGSRIVETTRSAPRVLRR